MRPITDEQIETLAKWLMNGATLGVACDAVRMSRQTHFNYMKRGRAEHERLLADAAAEVLPDEERYLNFFYKITEAQSVQVLSIEGRFHTGAREDWRAAAAWLEKSPSSSWNAGLRTLNALTDDALSALGLHKRMTKEQRRQLGKLIKKDEEAAAAALIIFNLAREIIDMDITQIQAVDDQTHIHLTDAKLDEMMREKGLLDDDGSSR